MKTVVTATRTLFPVVGRDVAHSTSRRSREGSSLLGGLIAMAFALTPLAVIIRAMVETA